jgi:hypothetical protein
MNVYTRVIVIVLIVIALAQVVPEAINWLLVLILASMLVMQAGQFAKLIGMLKL